MYNKKKRGKIQIRFLEEERIRCSLHRMQFPGPRYVSRILMTAELPGPQHVVLEVLLRVHTADVCEEGLVIFCRHSVPKTFVVLVSEVPFFGGVVL